MKGIIVLLCALSTALADSSCELPPGMKTMRECCNVPSHSNAMLQSMCTSNCMVKSQELQYECAVECYVNMTNLIKDGTINKAAAIKIYENNGFHDAAWSKQIREGVDKCSYDPTGPLEHNLLKFYNCVDDFLSENCVHSIQTAECEPTEEFYDHCRNIQPNCTSWPRTLMHPESCCKTPQILSQELNDKCRIECQRKEFFSQRQFECAHNCSYLESGLIVEGKVNFAVVKKMLSENSKNAEAWEKPIDSAVETCEKNLKGEKKRLYFETHSLILNFFFNIHSRI